MSDCKIDKNKLNQSKNIKENKNVLKRKKTQKRNFWPIKAFLIALVLSICFTSFSKIAFSNTSIVLACFALVFFVVVGAVADAIGVAVTTCSDVAFLAMASKKVYGAKASVALIKSKETVASICCDIIGDVCSIVSGSVVAGLVIQISINATGTTELILEIFVSAILGATTVATKALSKIYSVKHSFFIVRQAGVVFSHFRPKKYGPKHKHHKYAWVERKHNNNKKHLDIKQSECTRKVIKQNAYSK